MKLIDRRGDTLRYRVYSYQGRTINMKRKVRVYRNLRKAGVWYSILQDGRVVGHAKALMLVGCKFIVNQAGRKRVLKTGQKNVHAFVEGYIVDSAMGMSPETGGKLPVGVTYNPKRANRFESKDFTPHFYLKGAEAVCFNENGASAAYTYKDNRS